MTITNLTRTAVVASSEKAQPQWSPARLIVSAAAWLMEKDSSYREMRKLRRMPDVRLKDMGLTRKEANTEFYQRYSHRDGIGSW